MLVLLVIVGKLLGAKVGEELICNLEVYSSCALNSYPLEAAGVIQAGRSCHRKFENRLATDDAIEVVSQSQDVRLLP